MPEENVNLSELSDSILSSVKKLVGVMDDDPSFDLNIMLNVNAACSTLYQLGVLSKPYTVTSKLDTYKDLLPYASDDIVNQVKMYLVYKTALGFDATSMTSSLIEVYKELIREAEWRLCSACNPPGCFDSEVYEDV